MPSNYWDDLGISPEGAFGRTVGRALDDGLLTDADYDAILDAIGRLATAAEVVAQLTAPIVAQEREFVALRVLPAAVEARAPAR